MKNKKFIPHMREQYREKLQLRYFGWIMTGFFPVVFGMVLPWLWSLPWPYWPWVVAGIFGALAWLHPLALKKVYACWMGLAHALAWINTRLILGVVFVLIFIPLGVGLRLLGRDTLQKKWDAHLVSYRINTSARKAEHMERQF